MNSDHGMRDLSEITVGQAQPEPIVVPRNPDGTFTLPSGAPARTYAPLIDGGARAGIEGDHTARHMPQRLGRLDRRLQARAALEGNELLMVNGEIRIRRQR